MKLCVEAWGLSYARKNPQGWGGGRFGREMPLPEDCVKEGIQSETTDGLFHPEWQARQGKTTSGEKSADKK